MKKINLAACFVMLGLLCSELAGAPVSIKNDSVAQMFETDVSNLLSQEERVGSRPVYEFSFENENLLIDVDKAAGSTNEDTLGTGSYNSYNFTQMLYKISEDTSEVADMSEFPFITMRLKSSEANQALFRLFCTSGSHKSNGVNINVLTSDIPADEWVTIQLDYTGMFHYNRSGTDYFPDSSEVYMLGIVFGNTDSQGNLLQADIEVDYIKFGEAAIVRNPMLTEEFDSESSLNLFDQESRVGTRPVYEMSLNSDTLVIDIDKAAGSLQPDSLPNNYRFTQMFYYFSENGSELADLSQNPFMSIRLKASKANQMLIRLFSKSGSHSSNGVALNTVKTFELPADEWVTINVDYTNQFAYLRNAVMYYPDSASLYRMGIVFGNTDELTNLLQGTVEIDYIRFGEAAIVRENSIVQEFDNSSVLDQFSQEDRFITRDVYQLDFRNDTLLIDVDKAAGSTNEDTLGTGSYNGYRFTQLFYNISVNNNILADLSEYPYISMRLKSSEANQALFRLFCTSGSHNSNGVNINTLTYDIPADEWVTIQLDYTGMFKYNKSGTDYFPDSTSVYRLGMIFGNTDMQGDLLQANVEIDYIKFGEAAIPLSSNTFLTDISLDDISLQGFDKNTFTYTVALLAGSEIPVVDGTLEDETASISVTQAEGLPGTATIEVTAEDESVQVYTIEFTIVDNVAQNEVPVYSVYPNPVEDQLNIVSDAGIKNISILSLDGRLIDSVEGLNTVSVSHLKAGTYVARIEFNNRHTSYHRLLKK